MSIGNAAPAAYSPMESSVRAFRLDGDADAGGRGRRHAGQPVESTPGDQAAASFASYAQAPDASVGQTPGTGEKLLTFTLNRALDAALPMSGWIDNAKCLYESIKEGIAGQPRSDQAKDSTAEPVALSTGRARRSPGFSPPLPGARDQSRNQRAARRHPLVELTSTQTMKLYREMSRLRPIPDAQQAAGKPAERPDSKAL